MASMFNHILKRLLSDPASKLLTPEGKNKLYEAIHEQGLKANIEGNNVALASSGTFQISEATQRVPLPELRDPASGQISAYAKLAMRMGWLDEPRANFNVHPKEWSFVEVAKTSEGHVVFLVVKGKPMTIEDDGLFPSDQLITKLKLLSGE